jgi:hypothetical protein
MGGRGSWARHSFTCPIPAQNDTAGSLLEALVPWDWTGFTGNTLWDWMHLLLVPILFPLILMPTALNYIRGGIDERREAAEAAANGDADPADDPIASLDRAVAAATVGGPKVGLALLEPLENPLAGDYRLHAARAHLLEMVGQDDGAIADYRAAASRTKNPREEEFPAGAGGPARSGSGGVTLRKPPGPAARAAGRASAPAIHAA